jgi:YidC/Oxa1 family membrane protein insertase
MQNNNRKSNLTTFLLIYLVGWFLLWQWMGSKQHAQAPVPLATIEQQAKDAEAKANDVQHFSLSDRVKSYQAAISRYQEIYHRDTKTPEEQNTAINARYQELRLLRQLADVESKGETEKINTAHYDQAESLLKDMEAHLSGRSAKVVLTPGKPAVAIADVGKDASQRLTEVREARDQVNRHDVRYLIMDWLVRATGRRPWFSYWFALVALTAVLKTLLWPVNRKQFQSMRDMQRIAPLIKDAQEKMKGRPPDEIQKRMMQVYKENHVNMAGGCLPMVIQMLVLIPVYSMIRMYEFQMSKGYFLWIGSEWSHQWPMWLGKNLATFDLPMSVLYLVSMVLYSFLQPKAADPQQAQQQKLMTWMMPAILGFFMWQSKWSSAFVFYWLLTNLIGLWQNWRLLHEFGPTVPAAAGAGDGSGGAPVPTEPLKPMQSGPTRNGNGRRPATGGPQPRRRKPRSRT